MLIRLNPNTLALRQSAPDSRDYLYRRSNETLKPNVDLRQYDSLVESQLDLGSCVGNAITNCYELQVKQLYLDTFVDLSRLFVYYNARLLDGTIDTDVGTTIRSGIRAGNHFGLCTEDLWPYDIAKFSTRPTPECYRDGSTRTITQYQSLAGLEDIIDCLNSGNPAVIGTHLYESFMSLDKDNPIVVFPGHDDQYIGAHAMVILGYDLNTKQLLAKNSFGVDWGENGYCYIPFYYAQKEFFERWMFQITDPGLRVITEITKNQK